MVDVENNTKNLNNLTKQTFVRNIQFVNDVFLKQFAVFSEFCSYC